MSSDVSLAMRVLRWLRVVVVGESGWEWLWLAMVNESGCVVPYWFRLVVVERY